MASALQLDRRFRWSLYVAVAVLFVTGAAWLIADQLKETPSGEFWQAATANLLMVHGNERQIVGKIECDHAISCLTRQIHPVEHGDERILDGVPFFLWRGDSRLQT